ncbi:MAG: helix-turn-helix domain-containing protein [Rhodovibrio sp.]|nr:helix-turn-helix domain-containing protein [Rhodovibrio sp.]
MPWKETCAMDEKVRFVVAYQKAEQSMTELCAAFGISRKTGYEVLERYREAGFDGLAPRSRAPHVHGRATSAELVQRIVALRRERPRWGPKKVRAELMRREPETLWPAPSTIGDILWRAGLIEARGRRRRPGPQRPLSVPDEPNATWSADYKGWFRTGDNRRCDPLTINDGFSRYYLACTIVPPTTEGAWTVFERAFREYGLPGRIRSDNGVPFSSRGCAGLSRLNVWWIRLGIDIELIDPGQPQQNGRHERGHATLKAETSAPPAANPAAQQARFDAFCVDYNTQRPHEALGQEPPARHYAPSQRPYPDRLLEPWYDADHEVRKVRSGGEIKWRGERLFLSECLAGQPVGIRELSGGDWLVRFFDYELGVIERATMKLRSFGLPRPGRPKAEQTEKTVTHPTGL